MIWLLPPSNRPPVIWRDVQAWNIRFLRAFHPNQKVLMPDGRTLKMKEAIQLRIDQNKEETKI